MWKELLAAGTISLAALSCGGDGSKNTETSNVTRQTVDSFKCIDASSSISREVTLNLNEVYWIDVFIVKNGGDNLYLGDMRSMNGFLIDEKYKREGHEGFGVYSINHERDQLMRVNLLPGAIDDPKMKLNISVLCDTKGTDSEFPWRLLTPTPGIPGNRA